MSIKYNQYIPCDMFLYLSAWNIVVYLTLILMWSTTSEVYFVKVKGPSFLSLKIGHLICYFVCLKSVNVVGGHAADWLGVGYFPVFFLWQIWRSGRPSNLLTISDLSRFNKAMAYLLWAALGETNSAVLGLFWLFLSLFPTSAKIGEFSNNSLHQPKLVD